MAFGFYPVDENFLKEIYKGLIWHSKRMFDHFVRDFPRYWPDVAKALGFAEERRNQKLTHGHQNL